MKTTQPIHDADLRKIGDLALRAELLLERVQRKALNATRGQGLTVPLTVDELDTIADQLRTISKRWDDLTERVFKQEGEEAPRPEAQAV